MDLELRPGFAWGQSGLAGSATMTTSAAAGRVPLVRRMTFAPRERTAATSVVTT
jgi:hypothetical protein